jgi:hypothetical protein
MLLLLLTYPSNQFEAPTSAGLGGPPLIQRHLRRFLMTSVNFIGLDLDKKTRRRSIALLAPWL